MIGKEENKTMNNYKTLGSEFELKYAEFVHQLGVERGETDTSPKPHTDQMSFVLLHMALGLVTEAAEVADLIKKHMAYDRPLDVEKLKDELGDVQFYLVGAIVELGSSLKEIMTMNKAKLEARYPDGYSHHNANNRDLGSEKVAIEKSLDKGKTDE